MKRWMTLIIIMMVIVVCRQGDALAASFIDLENHWADKDIMQMVSRGAASGFPDGTFQPEAAVTRAQFVKLVVEGLGKREDVVQLKSVASAFGDVGETHWAKPYIQLGVELGITKGYDDGSFYPEQHITRQEMAVMVVRALHWENRQREFAGKKVVFSDAVLIGGWASSSVDMVSRVGILSGFPDGTFAPREWTTRAQATVVVKRLMEEKGVLLDFAGEVVRVDGNDGLLTLKSSDESAVQFKVAPECVIYMKNTTVGINNLEAGASIQGMLNDDREIVFIEYCGSGSNILAATVEVPDVPPDPVQSSRTTRAEIGALEFTEMYGRDGFGTTIAIIDTGIDAAHPDLQWTSQQQGKIMDWVDFTGEGRIDTTAVFNASDGQLSTSWGTFEVGAIPSKSNRYHLGFLDEREIGINGMDLNLNGSARDRIFVLVTDTQERYQYTTLYVDHDGDKSFADEQGMRVFKYSRQVGFFGADNPQTEYPEQTSFVVTEVEARGNFINLGFDINGHGTHVAGTAGAYSNDGTGMTGVAPGAQLMALKVADVEGEAAWEHIMAALDYAATHGAQIINISIGDMIEKNDGSSQIAQKIDEVSERYGVTVVAAAGNDGPGINTAATPGDAKSAISVGASISSTMWQTDYGYRVKDDGMWYYSALGPKKNGALFPQVVAPGSVVSTVPVWMDGGYALSEGTSMAAPHVAGAVALLLEQARAEGLEVTPDRMQKAVQMGALPLKQYPVAAQGFGLINISRTWEHLKGLKDSIPVITAIQIYPDEKEMPGLYAREYKPGKLYFKLDNESDADLRLTLSGQQNWLWPEMKQVYLPAHTQRIIAIDCQIASHASGLYSGLIMGDDSAYDGWELVLPVTIAVPEDLGVGTDLVLGGTLGAAQFAHYYFRVPQGTDKMTFTLAIPKNSTGEYEGRARMHIINPNGRQEKVTYYAGLDLDGIGHESEDGIIYNPQPGIWEVVVYSSATLSVYNHDRSRYLLRVKTIGREVQAPLPVIDTGKPELFVQTFTRQRLIARPGFITVRVCEAATLKPVDGFIKLDDTVYAVKNGVVSIPLLPQQQPKRMVIMNGNYQYVEREM